MHCVQLILGFGEQHHLGNIFIFFQIQQLLIILGSLLLFRSLEYVTFKNLQRLPYLISKLEGKRSINDVRRFLTPHSFLMSDFYLLISDFLGSFQTQPPLKSDIVNGCSLTQNSRIKR